MSQEFKEFVKKKAKEKNEIKSDLRCKILKEDFENKFPEFKNTIWVLEYKIIDDETYKILIDEIEIDIKRYSTTGYGLVYIHHLNVKCDKCDQVIKKHFIDIISLDNIINSKNICDKCSAN